MTSQSAYLLKKASAVLLKASCLEMLIERDACGSWEKIVKEWSVGSGSQKT
jgi:hypothetical protein